MSSIPSSSPDSARAASPLLRYEWVLLVGLLLLALVVRVPGLDQQVLIGDEYNTLNEIGNFSNPHAISYFLLMGVWTSVNDSAGWLRLFSVICGVLSVAAMWGWMRMLRGFGWALVAAAILALSPLAVPYARSIRFYAYHLLLAVLFFWAYSRVAFTAQKPTRGAIVALAVTGVLFATSHLMAWIAIGLTTLHFVMFRLRLPRWVYVGAVGLAAVVAVILVLSPTLVDQVYQLVQRAAGGLVIREYGGGRGVTLVTVGKLGIQYHNMLLGTQTYLFDLPIVVPMLLIGSVLVLVGMWALWKTSRAMLVFAILLSVGFLLLLYIGIDSLWPPDSPGSVSVRYTLLALPLLIWLLTEGIQRLPGVARVGGAVVILGASAVGTYNVYFSDIVDDNDRLLAIAEVGADALDQPVTLVVEGRAENLVRFYLPTETDALEMFRPSPEAEARLAQLPVGQQTYFISGDWRERQRCDYNATLAQFSQWRENYTSVMFPQFVYGYEWGVPAAVSPDGAVPMARTLFDLPYQDIRLPRDFTWDGATYTVNGMLTLPSCTGERGWQSGALDSQASQMLLLSQLVNADTVADGTEIGQITLTTANGSTLSLPIIKGEQTQSWKGGGCGNSCQPALDWRKYFHAVGFSGYPDAYQDFRAQIWGAEFTLPSTLTVTRIEIALSDPDSAYDFNIWGVYLFN